MAEWARAENRAEVSGTATYLEVPPFRREDGETFQPPPGRCDPRRMAGRECHHCKQWVEAGEPHDCWTTTEAALTEDLSDDLRDAWERLRETAAAFGDQRIYASHHSIMFSRESCYFFVRPKDPLRCVSFLAAP